MTIKKKGKFLTVYLWFALILSVYFMKYEYFLIATLALMSMITVFLISFKVNKLMLIIVINISYWIFSGLASGALAIKDLYNPDFYDGEGRIFIYYLPIVLILLIPRTYFNFKDLNKFLFFLMIISVGISIHAVTFLFGAGGDFSGFLTHHSGAGTFIGVIFSFLFVYAKVSKKRIYLYVSLMLILPILLTHSRESWMACFAVVFWWYFANGKLRSIRDYLISGVVVSALLLSLAQTDAFETKIKPLLSTSIGETAISLIENDNWVPSDGMQFFSEGHNFLMRVRYYTYAIRMFIDSPIIGSGFGRFNDLNTESLNIPMFQVLTSGEKVFSVQHAHNSYLQFLAEGGIIGLSLMLWFWISVYSKLKSYAQYFRYYAVPSSCFKSAQAIVVFISVASLTGHAMAAPSLGLIALSLIGISLKYGEVLLKNYGATEGNYTVEITESGGKIAS